MARMKQRSPERCPTHPGAFLREMVLPAVSASKVEIAAALGISQATVGREWAVATSSASWLRMQAAHDLWHAEREIDTSKLQPLPRAS